MVYAKCHPDREHSDHGLCDPCRKRARYWRLRTAGCSGWLATGHSVASWPHHYRNTKRWRERYPEKMRAAMQRYRDKWQRLYGGLDDNFHARIRRFEAKAKERMADSIRTQRGANRETFRYAVAAGQRKQKPKNRRKKDESRQAKRTRRRRR
jgi:hypothetical protein